MTIIPHLNIDESVKPLGIENVHHIVAKHEGCSNVSYNKIRLYEQLHEALHRVFGTLPPHEQIKRILDISQTALQDNFLDDVTRITNKNNNYIYKKGIRQK